MDIVSASDVLGKGDMIIHTIETIYHIVFITNY